MLEFLREIAAFDPRAFPYYLLEIWRVVREKVQKFLEAACSGDVELFKKLAKQLDDGKGLAGTVADVKDANKRGALIFAAREGKTEFCKYLVEELKIDVNEKDEEGETPVLHAARHGHTATVHYMYSSIFYPFFHRATFYCALVLFAGHIEVVKLLLSKGVNVDFQGDAGTPLMWAAGFCHHDVVKVLLEHCTNLHAQTEDDKCLLISAVAANSLPCVELLVKAGANVNVKAGDATTPLLIAALNGSAEIINCLLQAGADPNAVDKDGDKPIQLAPARGSRAAVEALLAVTPRIQSERLDAGRKANKSRETTIPKKDLPEVTPGAKKNAAEAKARGDEAFKRNDIATAIDAYTQAINFDPTDGTLFSNRSLCWIHMGQPEPALSDAKACRELRPYWAEACYREGTALRLRKACPSSP
ncbi:hypothetical protein BC332_21740 [Capsicum chinense]|nr:hypothetical protein BC332_21740 [Capsicum chinense]